MAKIFINDTGDRSVGIGINEVTIDWNLDLKKLDDNYRNELRETFADFFHNSLDFMGAINVTFEDECPDCHEKLTDNECKNKDCIRNLWREENGDINKC